MCPNGITAKGEGMALIGSEEDGDADTCGEIVSMASAVDTSSPLCVSLQMSQFFCCPDDVKEADDPCEGA